MITDYTKNGISNDDPDVVKGRAGSPYAVKDYYNVNPDLAENVENRLEEFKSLIERSHAVGLKVIIDIVPNHVARNYQSLSSPEGVEGFGENDDKNVVYHVNNNFYYNPKEPFNVPKWENGYSPLGAEKHPLEDHKFDEIPAKWTGNGSRLSQPIFTDWYETIKINYGISPEGKKDFDELPIGFENEAYQKHYGFWENENYTSIDLTQNLRNVLKNGTQIFGIYGNEDGLYSKEQVMKIKEIVSLNNFRYLNDCSHNVFIDQQDKFIVTLKTWIK